MTLFTEKEPEKTGNVRDHSKTKFLVIGILAAAVIAGVIIIAALSGDKPGKILPGTWVCSAQDMTMTVNEDMTCAIYTGSEETRSGRIKKKKKKISGIYPVYIINTTYFLARDDDGNLWLYDHNEYGTDICNYSFKKAS